MRCCSAFFENHRDLLDGQRLFEKIEGAQLGGLDRGFDGAMAGDDHHRRAKLEWDFLNARERFQTVHSRQPDVEQHQLVGVPLEFAAALFTALDGGGVITLIFEHAAQRLPYERLVVDDQDTCIFHEAAASIGTAAGMTGISTMNRAPEGMLSSTRIKASWSERIRLTIARPSPVPRPLVEKYGKNSFSLSSREMPQPVSATISSTESASVARVAI